MKAKVDKDLCIGCGACPGICPEIFELEDDGLAVAKSGDIASDLQDSAREACESCPVDAISIEE